MKSLQIILLLSFTLALSLLMTACGNNASTSSGNTSTGSGNINTSTGSTPHSQSTTSNLPMVNCGSISQADNGTIRSKTDPKVTGDCFWQAFQQCSTASLHFIHTSVDTTRTQIFEVHKTGTSCQISESVETRIIPQPAKHLYTYHCASLKKEATSLQFQKCDADGTIMVPLSK